MRSSPPPSHEDPVAARLRRAEPCLWFNPRRRDTAARLPVAGTQIGLDDMEAAAARFARCAPLLAQVFPELRAAGGVIESPLLRAPGLHPAAGLAPGQGALWIKADHGLPVAGSDKARGGIHEVLELAERLALRHGLLAPQSGPGDYRALAGPAARAVLARHTVAVGTPATRGRG